MKAKPKEFFVPKTGNLPKTKTNDFKEDHNFL